MSLRREKEKTGAEGDGRLVMQPKTLREMEKIGDNHSGTMSRNILHI